MDRGHLFREVHNHAPGLSAFIKWSYGSHSPLFFGTYELVSQTGVHQGDPLGPLLFALGLHSLVLRLALEVPDLILQAWYLDDGLLAGSPIHLLKAILIILEVAPNVGIRLSLSKSTFWCHPSCRKAAPEGVDLNNFPINEVKEEGIILLGAPVGTPAFYRVATKSRLDKTVNIMEKLQDLGGTNPICSP
jgi:hypothetical protein